MHLRLISLKGIFQTCLAVDALMTLGNTELDKTDFIINLALESFKIRDFDSSKRILDANEESESYSTTSHRSAA